MAVQIQWHGGKEPRDQDNCFSKNRSLATYTGMMEDGDIAVGVAEDEQSESGGSECRPAGVSSKELGEMIARARERLTQEQVLRRPVEESTRQAKNGENPSKQQKGQVGVSPVKVAGVSRTVLPKARAIEVDGSDDELYFLAQKRMEARAEDPLVIESNLQQHQLVMISRAVRGSVVVEIDTDDEPQSEEKPTPTTEILRFPLSEERQRADKFYRETGIKFDDFIEEVLKPGWTVAEMIDPREHARRMKIFFCDRVYDAELAKLRITKAVDEFLHKKRPYRTDTQQARAQLD